MSDRRLIPHIRRYPPVGGILFSWQGGLLQRTNYNNQIWTAR
jgi:hypothetical protein